MLHVYKKSLFADFSNNCLLLNYSKIWTTQRSTIGRNTWLSWIAPMISSNWLNARMAYKCCSESSSERNANSRKLSSLLHVHSLHTVTKYQLRRPGCCALIGCQRRSVIGRRNNIAADRGKSHCVDSGDEMSEQQPPPLDARPTAEAAAASAG